VVCAEQSSREAIFNALRRNETYGTSGPHIVRGWPDDADKYHVQVFDVGGDPNNGASVDLDTCEARPGAGGFPELCATWTDPSFDAAHPAFYYARVLENPVCRWTTWQCNADGETLSGRRGACESSWNSDSSSTPDETCRRPKRCDPNRPRCSKRWFGGFRRHLD